VVNLIYDRVVEPQQLGGGDLRAYAMAAREALYLVEDRAKIERMLGDSGPRLLASQLHPTVWDAAKSRRADV